MKVKELFLSNSQYKQYMKFISELESICKVERIVTLKDKDRGRKIIKLSLKNDRDDINNQILQLKKSYSTEADGSTGDNPDKHIKLSFNVYINELDKSGNLADASKSFISVMENLISIPLYTTEGMLINGQQYKFATSVEAEKGFQIKKTIDVVKSTVDFKKLTVAFRPERGTEVEISRNEKYYRVTSKKEGIDKSVELTLLDLMIAYSGADINVILNDVSSGRVHGGTDLLFPKETSRVFNNTICRRRMLKALIPFVNLPNDYVVDDIFNKRILAGNLFKLTPTAKANAERVFSFTNRCFNQILAADMEYTTINESGSKVKHYLHQGDKLTVDILGQIDNDTSISEMYILQNGIDTRIVKRPISNIADYNFFVNVCNIIAVESYSENDIINIDSLQNKTYFNSFIFLKEFVENALDSVVNKITNYLNLHDTLGIPNPKDKEMKDLDKLCNFSSYYKSLRERGNVACIQPLVGRNTVSDSSGDYKTTSGLKNPTKAARAVRLENIFFLDSQASPESDKAGITQHLSCTAFVNEEGHLANYFRRVENGVVTDDEVVLTVQDAYSKIICPNHWENPTEVVDVVTKGTVMRVVATEVEYVPIVPMSVSSPTISIGVGVNSNKGRRAQMAGNHAEQYTPVLGGERHHVTTGVSSFWDSKIIRADEILDDLENLSGTFNKSLGIRLVNVIMQGETMICSFAAVDESVNKTIDVTVAYLKTIAQMVIGYELNTNTGREEPIWLPGEIVLHPMDIDTHRPNNVYLPEDITGVRKFDGFGYLDRNDIKEAIAEKDLAMGVNLRVAFMSFHGYSYEDGILVRRGLVESMKLSNVFTHVMSCEIPSDSELSSDEIINRKSNLVNGEPKVNEYYADGSTILALQRLDEDVSDTITTYNNSGKRPVKEITVKPGQGGYVQSIRYSKKSNDPTTRVISITLGNIKNLEVGDKFTGHHGNKGVITRILKDSEMPCDENGNPVDICVNPLGVPSRMNLGQLIELALGLSVDDSVIVVPTNTAYDDLVSSLQSSKNVNEAFFKESNLITLYNNETLMPYPNKVNVGTMYIMKLDHSVSKKMNFINESKHKDMKTGQPRKSDLTPGGQSASEYASNAILANGAYLTHSYLFGAGSDDQHARNKLKAELSDTGRTDIIGDNKTNELLLAYLRTVGYDMSGVIRDGISLKVTTDSDIYAISDFKVPYNSNVREMLEVGSSNLQTNENKRRNSFGSKEYSHVEYNNIAWVNPAILNAEMCKLFPVMYVNKKGEVNYKPMTIKMVKAVINGSAYLAIKNEKRYNGTQFKHVIINMNGDPNLTMNLNEVYYTGGFAFFLMFSLITKEDIFNFVSYINESSISTDNQDRMEDDSDNDIVDDILESSTDDDFEEDDPKASFSVSWKDSIKSSWKNFSEPSEYITNKFLLIPLKFRKPQKDRGLTDPLNIIYIKVLNLLNLVMGSNLDMWNGDIYDIMAVCRDDISAINRYNDFYKVWFTVCINTDISSLFKNSRGIKSPWAMIKEKDNGVIRASILKKTINFSGRSTIVGAPDLKIDEVYLPREAIFEMYKYNIRGWLKNSYELGSLVEHLNGSEDIDKIVKCYAQRSPAKLYALLKSGAIKFTTDSTSCTPYQLESGKTLIESGKTVDEIKTMLMDYDTLVEIGELIDEIINEHLADERVLLTREPALHRQNVQAYTPLMWENKTIGINTLICASFNADFDGDQMAVYAVMPESCKKECDEKLSPTNLLTEDRKGGNNYALKQDCVLGFYSATCIDPNPSNIIAKFNSINELIKAVKLMQVGLNDTVHLVNPERISTAGRLFVEASLPGNIDLTRDIEGEGLYPLKSKNVDKMVMYYLPNSNPKFEQDYQLLTGSEWDASDFIDFLNDMKLEGFLLQDLNNTTLAFEDFSALNTIAHNALSTDTRKIVEFKSMCGFYSNSIDVQRLEDDKTSKSAIKKIQKVMEKNKNSNLYRIFDSGSRGSFNSLTAPLIYEGYLKDINDELVPTSIRHDLYDGLNSLELFLSGFEVRRAQLSTTLATKDAGVMTRTLNFMANDEYISKTDCGAKPREYEMYFEPDSSCEERFFEVCAHKKLLADTSRLSDEEAAEQQKVLDILQDRVLDKGCYNFLVSNKIKKIYCVDSSGDICSFVFNYKVADETYKRFTNRYGYKYGDNSKQIILTKEHIDEYINAGSTTIFARTLHDCKCSEGICACCYGEDIHKDRPIVEHVGVQPARLLPANNAVGTITAEVIGEILSQMAMDVKNASSEQDTTTNVVKRVTQIINMSDNERKNTRYINTSLYLQPGEIATFSETGKVVIIKGKKIKEYFAPKSRILFGGTLKVFRDDKPIRIIAGEDNFSKLLKLLPYKDLVEMIYNEIASIIRNLNADIDSRYIELLTHSMSRNSVITDSSIPDLTVGQIMDTNKINQLEQLGGVEIKHQPIVTNYAESNAGRGIIKSLCGQNPQKAISINIKRGIKDDGSAFYSRSILGIQFGKECSDFEIGLTDKKNYTKHIVKASRMYSNEEELIQQNVVTNDDDIFTSVETSEFGAKGLFNQVLNDSDDVDITKDETIKSINKVNNEDDVTTTLFFET